MFVDEVAALLDPPVVATVLLLEVPVDVPLPVLPLVPLVLLDVPLPLVEVSLPVVDELPELVELPVLLDVPLELDDLVPVVVEVVVVVVLLVLFLAALFVATTTIAIISNNIKTIIAVAKIITLRRLFFSASKLYIKIKLLYLMISHFCQKSNLIVLVCVVSCRNRLLTLNLYIVA